MSRKVQLVLLCEDSQHEAFVRRFLKKAGWNTRSLKVEKAPQGRGAGEQFVRKRYPVELAAQRRRHAAQALVVMIDGDVAGVTARLQTLNETCIAQKIAVRAADEPVAVFVPTRNIETWFAYLDGTQIDETQQYPRLAKERECKEHVEALHAMCQAGQLRQPAPASLQAACNEYERLREVVP